MEKERGPQGPLQGYAARGLDVPYQAERAAAKEELESTLAGPTDYIESSVRATMDREPAGKS
jgi:hypothetical protein